MIHTKTEVLKICLIATLPTTNPTWTGLVLKPGIRDDRLYYIAAFYRH